MVAITKERMKKTNLTTSCDGDYIAWRQLKKYLDKFHEVITSTTGNGRQRTETWEAVSNLTEEKKTCLCHRDNSWDDDKDDETTEYVTLAGVTT